MIKGSHFGNYDAAACLFEPHVRHHVSVSGPDYRPLSRYTKRQWLLNSYCSVPQVVYMLIMGTQVSQ
jgi:hypothetical protein